MPVLTYKEPDKEVDAVDIAVELQEGVSVLEALESQGARIPFSCRAGMCQSCMMQSDHPVPASAQQGLSTSQIAQGCFLPCVCYPTDDLRVRMIGSSDQVQGTVVAKKMLNTSVLSLSLQVDFRWFPGQFITLWKDDTDGRAYSIASRCDEEKTLELHIKRHDQGTVSRWAHDDVSEGDMLTVSTPLGDCFYTDEHHDKPIVMVGTGTGLAPLYGILQEAIHHQHSAPIYVYAASGDVSGLYYCDELIALANEYEHIHYLPTVRRLSNDGIQAGHVIETEVIEGDVIDVVKARHPDLKGHKIFLCGSPEVVKTMQRNCFFQGATVSDILMDAFDMVIPTS